MDNDLFPYQQEGARWLLDPLASNKFRLLADEMRLGKTAQVLEAINLDTSISRVLVVCPAIARPVWEAERQTFSRRTYHISVVSYDSTFLKGSKKLQPKKELLQPWDLLVVDECHYLANPETQRTRTVYLHVAPYASRVWCLSGTPARNHNGDLYTFLRAAEVIKTTHSVFVSQYCLTTTTVYGLQIIGSQRIDELKSILAPHTLRRRKVDVLPQLPPISFHHTPVEAGLVDVKRWYPEIYLGMTDLETVKNQVAQEIATIDAMARTMGGETDDFAKALSSLQARTNASRRWTELQKCMPVAEMIHEELLSGAYDKIVIFCWHANAVEEMWYQLKPFNPVRVWGATSDRNRRKAEREFQQDPKCRVFIGNIQAAGVAINLNAAHEVAFLGSSYVPSDNAQAAMRCHDVRQLHPVRVRFFYIPGTTDEKVQKILKRKTRDLVQLFDDPKPVDIFAED